MFAVSRRHPFPLLELGLGFPAPITWRAGFCLVTLGSPTRQLRPPAPRLSPDATATVQNAEDCGFEHLCLGLLLESDVFLLT